MKRNHAVLILGIMLILIQTCYADISTDLTVHLTLDSNLTDAVGSSDGTHTGGPAPVFYETDGMVNGYAELDTTEIELDGSLFDWEGDESFTVSLWMRDEEGSHAVIMGRDDSKDVPGSDVHWWLGTSAGGTPTSWLLDSHREGPAGINGETDVCDGDWHHLAFVHDADKEMFYLYVDGFAEDSIAALYNNNFSSDTTVTIGYMQLMHGFHYSGDLDDVRMYYRALSANDIDELYQYSGETEIDDSDRINRNAETFQLMQNYPNPFNGETVISGRLPVVSFIEITVYNAAGQFVKQLLPGTMKQGYYEVVWDGTDQYGKMVSSGIYFYRLKAGDRIELKKMLFTQ